MIDELEAGLAGELPPDGEVAATELAEEERPDEERPDGGRHEHLQRVMGELGELRKRAEELERLLSREEEPPPADPDAADSLAETVQPWADEYYREYLDLGFSEEEASERAWRKAHAEQGRVQELAERIAEEKYGKPAEPSAGPQVLKEAVEQVYAAMPTDSISPDEVLEEMIREYPISEFVKVPAEHQPMLVALARDLMIGRRYREGQLSPIRPQPAPVPNTGPGGILHGGSAISPAHAQRIAQWRRVMGKAGDGVSDEQVLGRIREYEREGRPA